MYIRNEVKGTQQAKELKVRIPIAQHIQLHSLKVMTGKQISDAVAEALDAYFELLREPEAPTRQI